MSDNEISAIKEIIYTNNKYLLSEIQGGNDLLKSKLNQLIEKIDNTNVQVYKNTKKIQDINNNPALKPIFNRPYLFIILGLLFSLIILGFISISDVFGLIKIIK